MRTVILLLFACTTAATSLHAQRKAVTENGDQVILYDDGTWKAVTDSTADSDTVKIATNPKPFAKEASSSFLVKSATAPPVAVWIDATKWTFVKKKEGPQEYAFEMKSGDLYGMLISEKIELPLEKLREVAVENARNAAPDMRVTHLEYRTVNGLKVLNMEMRGSTSGVHFVYYGYYYTDTNGTYQLVVFTAEKLWDNTNKAKAEAFLNGLTEHQ